MQPANRRGEILENYFDVKNTFESPAHVVKKLLWYIF